MECPFAECLRQLLVECAKGINVECDMDSLIGMVEGVHCFRVDGSLQASFDWHTDWFDLCLPEENMDNMRSFVVQLSGAAITAMQVYGFDPHLFIGRGHVAAFHGSAVHRSYPTKLAEREFVWKLAFFLVIPFKERPPPTQQMLLPPPKKAKVTKPQLPLMKCEKPGGSSDGPLIVDG